MSTTLIHNEIRRARLELGQMTQEGLARRCGVSARPSSPWKWKPANAPSLELAVRIAYAFGGSVDDVFF